MKGPVTSHRESCLHQARVYLQQAREFRLRRTAGEAISMPEGGWFFSLLDFAVSRRDQVYGLPDSRWWRIGKVVFECKGYGYNGIVVIDIPAFRVTGRGGWYGVHETCIQRTKMRAFLDRCEALGNDEPTRLLAAQIHRLERRGQWQPRAKVAVDACLDDDDKAEPTGQMELFA